MLPTEGDLERDQFDTDAAHHCLLYCDGALIGGFRAIPCNCDYLSKSKFPQLASERAFPESADYWEISRFGVMSAGRALEAGKLNYALMFRFAQLRAATALVAMADLAYERFLKSMRVNTVRYGAAQVVGFDRRGSPLTVVAGEIPLDSARNPSISKFIELSHRMEITDAAHVLGRPTVSA